MTLRVLLVDESEERAELLREALSHHQYRVVKCIKPGENLLEQMAETRPDVVIIDMESPSRDVLEDVQTLSREQPRPVVLFSHDGDETKIRASIDAGVSAYIVDGLESSRVKPILDVAVARFHQFQKLQQELHKAQSSLAERKVIERAKGILMKRNRCDEEAAYKALRQMAMSSNQRLVDVAEKVIQVAEILKA